jgi:hypothetical protein
MCMKTAWFYTNKFYFCTACADTVKFPLVGWNTKFSCNPRYALHWLCRVVQKCTHLHDLAHKVSEEWCWLQPFQDWIYSDLWCFFNKAFACVPLIRFYMLLYNYFSKGFLNSPNDKQPHKWLWDTVICLKPQFEIGPSTTQTRLSPQYIVAVRQCYFQHAVAKQLLTTCHN